MGGFSGTLGTLAIEIVGKLGEFEAAMEDLSRETEKAVSDVRERFGGLNDIAGGLKTTGIALTAAITAPIVGIGVAAVASGAEFESALNKIEAQGGITGTALETLRQQALDLGASTQFSAQDAAEAMGVLAASGRTATEIFGQMPGVLDLAAAGEMAVAEAARISTALLNQFGLDATAASVASDLLAAASAASSANVTDFGNAMSFAGGIAHSAGLSLSETAAAMVLMNQQGLEGSKMGTGLREVIASLINPTNEAAEELERLKIKTTDATGKMLPLVDIVKQAEKSAMDTTSAFQIFGSQGATAFLALKNEGSAALAQVTTDLANSDGAAKRMAETLQKGLKGAFEQMKGSVETAGIALGTALLPHIQALVQWGTRMVNEFVIPAVKWFSDLSPPMQTLALSIAGVAAAAGPLLLVAGGLASTFVSVAEAVAILSGPTALAGLSGILAVLGPVIFAVGAAFATWYLLDTTGELATLSTEVGELKLALDGMWDSIVRLGESLGILDVNTGNVNTTFRSLWSLLGEIVAGPLRVTIEGLTSLATAVGWVADKATALRNLLPNVTTGLNEVKGAVQQQSTGVQGLMGLYGELATATAAVGTETKKATTEADANTAAARRNAKASKKSKEEKEKEKEELKAWQREVKFANDRVNDLLAAQERSRKETQDHAEAVRKITIDMEAFADAIHKKNLPELENLWDSLKRVEGKVGDVKLPVWQLGQELEKLGVTSAATATRVYEDAKKSYDAVLQTGQATQWEKDNALVRVLEAQRAAMLANGQSIPADFDKMLDDLKLKAEGKLPETEGLFKTFGTNVSTVITNFAQDISKSLWDGDMSWGEKGKSLLSSLGQAVTSSFIEPATAALNTFITGVLADLLGGKGFGGVWDSITGIGSAIGGVFGKGGSGGGGGTPGFIGSGIDLMGGLKGIKVPGLGGAGGLLKGGMGGVTGILGAVGGIGSMVSGIIGNFQNARLEGTMNAVEENTRYGMIHAYYILDNLNTQLPLLWYLPAMLQFFQDWNQPFWEMRWFAMELSDALDDNNSFWGRAAIAAERLLKVTEDAFAFQSAKLDAMLELATQQLEVATRSYQVTLVGTDPKAVATKMGMDLKMQGGLA